MTEHNKNKTIHFRVSAEDKTIIEAKKPAGISMTNHLTYLAIHHQARKPVEKELLFQLSKIGNNLNQITARLHKNKIGTIELYTMLSMAYEEVSILNSLIDYDS